MPMPPHEIAAGSVKVVAGCIVGHKHVRAETAELDLDEVQIDEDEIDTGLPMPPHKIATGSHRHGDLGELAEHEVEELDAADSDVIDEGSAEEQELDAFIEGKKRPSHLDE
jgi:hypothetical protein